MNAAPPPPKSGMPTWLIVVLCIVGAFVILIPIVGVLGIYGVRKYIAAAKTAEARNSVAEIAKDALTSYSNGYCASASRPVPASTASVRGTKYQSTPAEWSVDEARHAGFACLHFEIDMPQYYQYSYTSHPGRTGGFEATARGDLNGDGKLSTFQLEGTIVNGAPAVAPAISETDPEE